MARIFREKTEIPIPDNAYINHSDGRVFIFLREGNVLEKSRRKVIGLATSNSTMFPNSNFRYMYPALWEEYYGKKDKLPELYMHIGLYALCLGLGHKTNVYPLLQKSHGPLYSNAIMDFVMHTMITKTDVSQTFYETMRKEVTFSTTVPNDEWLSNMFAKKITEDMNNDFLFSWIENCKSTGVTEAWISIDGSNIDCTMSECSINELGHAKSLKNMPIVSYMYAVNSENGMPITYQTYNGSKVDSKAFMKMSAQLKLHGINTKGVILDCTFCTTDVFNELINNHIPYVIKLKSDTFAHIELYNKASNCIHWNLNHLINEESLFGISFNEKSKVFKNSNIESYVSLFFDGINGSDRKTTLIRKVVREANKISKQISKGDELIIDDELKRFISIKYENDIPEIDFNVENWQSAIDAKDYYSLATNNYMNPAKVSHLYDLRDKSETQYMIQKSQLGFSVMRVQSKETLDSRFFVCFIASIIRNQIMRSCIELELDNNANRIIAEIDRITLSLTENGTYITIHDETKKQKKILASVGILPKDLDTLSAEVNTRKGPITSLFRQMPEQKDNISAKPGRGRKKKEKSKDETERVKRPVGRPKGSGKKTDNQPKQLIEKKKAGRPKGSKNKKTIEAQKPKKGRPLGSKNKKTLEREAAEAAARAAIPKRRPGRPKGSKNKPKKISRE